MTPGTPDVGKPVPLLAMAATFALGVMVIPASLRFVLIPAALLIPGHAMVCAIFGSALPFGGFRKVSLMIVLSLTSYPVSAIAAISVGIRLTRVSVVVTMLLLVLVCAAIVDFRNRRSGDVALGMPNGDRNVATNGAAPEVPVQWTSLLVPGAAMVLAALIIAVSPVVLPRASPQEFTTFSLSNRWSLVAGSVPIPEGSEPTVQVQLVNSSTQEQTYRLEPSVQNGDAWEPTVITLAAGERWNGSVTGPVPASVCRARLEIDLVQEGSAVDFDPLVLFFDDPALDC